MKNLLLSKPEVGLVAVTRALLGLGAGLLLASQVSSSTRRIAGWTLFATGALTTIPLFMLLIMNGGQLLVGLASTRSSNADREWNARFNAWMLIAMLGWAGACGIILLLPPLFEHGWRDPRLLGLHAVGALSGVIAALLGGSPATPAAHAGARTPTVRPRLPATAKRIAAALEALQGSGQKRMIALLELAELNLANL